MSDDRLFTSNNAIGRKWYYLNLIILSALTYAVHLLFQYIIIPNTATEVYTQIAIGASYFVYIFLLITFFALVERRLYDVCEKRDSQLYKTASLLIKIVILFQIAVIALNWFPSGFQFDIYSLQNIATVLDFGFLIFVFAIGLFKGKITNVSKSDYKKRDKYR